MYNVIDWTKNNYDTRITKSLKESRQSVNEIWLATVLKNSMRNIKNHIEK